MNANKPTRLGKSPRCCVCGRPAESSRPAGDVHETCGRWSCRGKMLSQQAQRGFELRKRERLETVTKVYAPLAVPLARADGYSDADQLIPIVVPGHVPRTVPVPPERRAALIAHIEAQIHTAAETSCAPDSVVPPEERQCTSAAAAAARESKIWGQACATCGGRCCLNGARTMAFITPGTITRYRDAEAKDPEEILGDYERQMPDSHIENSCVYHTESGCALPREMRSGTCNRFVCEGLAELQSETAKRLDEGYLLIAVDEGELVNHTVIAAEDEPT